MTPADLLQAKQCTAACIAAVTSRTRCRCACSGAFHGLVATADISTLIDARRVGLHLLTDLEVISS